MSGTNADLTVERAKRGDVAAFEDLVREYERKIYSLCYGTMGNAEDASDMAQETLLKAWRAIDRFDGRSSVGTWLYRIAVNTCLDELRRRKNKAAVSMQELAEKGWEPTAAEDFTERSADRDEIRSAMNELSDEYRTVLMLRDARGLSYDELARVLDCPVGTVRSRLNRARNEFAKKLTGVERKHRNSV